VTVNYTDKEVSGHVYGDSEKAEKFAARQKKILDLAPSENRLN